MCVCACVLVTQSYPALCVPWAAALPGSSVHGIFQARILEWGAILFLRRSSRRRDRTQVSCTAGRYLTVWAAKEYLFIWLHRALVADPGSFFPPPNFNLLFCTGVQPINNVAVVSGEQQRDPAICIDIPILPQSPLPARPPRNIKQSSMCYTGGPYWLSILNIALCTNSSQTP